MYHDQGWVYQEKFCRLKNYVNLKKWKLLEHWGVTLPCTGHTKTTVLNDEKYASVKVCFHKVFDVRLNHYWKYLEFESRLPCVYYKEVLLLMN